MTATVAALVRAGVSNALRGWRPDRRHRAQVASSPQELSPGRV